MSVIHAIYENGVFRPTEPVELPDRCRVEFEPKLIEAEKLPMKERPAPGLGKGSLIYMAPDFDEPLDEFKEYM